MRSHLLLVVLLLAASTGPIAGQEPETLRVATKPFVPFAMEKEGRWEGFSIDLWNAIALELGLATEWVPTATVADLLATLTDGRAEAAMAGITITSEREKTIDFSHAFYESGLQVLVATDGQSSGLAVFKGLLSWALVKFVAGFLGILFLAANAMWLFEHRKNSAMFPTNYVKGVWEAFWWTAVTVTTVGYGDKSPIGVGGRIVGLIWMFAGIILISYFTASVTTILTVDRLEGSISGPEDLPGKRVATPAGTTASGWLASKGIDRVEVDSIESAYATLLDGKADAVVYDTPALVYYANHDGFGRVRAVGRVFAKQNYGIGLVQGSPWRERINRTLLVVREKGTYDDIYQKWFGAGQP